MTVSMPEPFMHVPDTVEAPALAREFATLHTSMFSVAVQDIVQLLVSEIVTNAYRHGEPPVRLAIERTGDVVRVEVHDYGPAFVAYVITDGDLERTGGWGLGIVAGLATSWGVTETAWDVGKRVWFELDTTGPFPQLPGVVH